MFIYNKVITTDEAFVDEVIRYELGKHYNGYVTEEMIENAWNDVEVIVTNDKHELNEYIANGYKLYL